MMVICLGCFYGFCLYGPVALYGVMAIEAAPSHMAGTCQAIVGLAANSQFIKYKSLFFLCMISNINYEYSETLMKGHPSARKTLLKRSLGNLMKVPDGTCLIQLNKLLINHDTCI